MDLTVYLKTPQNLLNILRQKIKRKKIIRGLKPLDLIMTE